MAMDTQEPQIIDLDPEGAPRMTAIILLVCGLMGVGFLVVNNLFTGEDPYYNEQQWMEGEEPENNRFDITPNLFRGKQVGGDSDEDEEAEDVPRVKTPTRKPTTGPVSPFQRSTPTGVARNAAATPTATPAPIAPTTPGGTATPAVPPK